MKCFMKYFKTFLSSLCAGAFIGIGCILYNLTLLAVPDPQLSWIKLLGSLLFSVGMVLVCISGTALFTGRVGFVHHGNVKENIIKLPIMLVGNIIGIACVGLLTYLIGATWFPEFTEIVRQTAASKYISDFQTSSGDLFFEALCCGIMVYLAVFSYKTFPQGVRILGVVLFITIFVFSGFQHSIANCFYYAFANNWDGEAWAHSYLYILGSFGLIVVGNSLGALLVYRATEAAREYFK